MKDPVSGERLPRPTKAERAMMKKYTRLERYGQHWNAVLQIRNQSFKLTGGMECSSAEAEWFQWMAVKALLSFLEEESRNRIKRP